MTVPLAISPAVSTSLLACAVYRTQCSTWYLDNSPPKPPVGPSIYSNKHMPSGPNCGRWVRAEDAEREPALHIFMVLSVGLPIGKAGRLIPGDGSQGDATSSTKTASEGVALDKFMLEQSPRVKDFPCMKIDFYIRRYLWPDD
ncbi:hypothetical protein SprV_0702372700 [Sparganum proliferum]